jgi:hypothetical protein
MPTLPKQLLRLHKRNPDPDPDPDPDSDPDADWMNQAEITPASSFNSRLQRNRFIPAIPKSFIEDTLIAGDALPLLLIILMEMRIRGTAEIAIGPMIWVEVGNPSKRIRARLLRQISKLPSRICDVTARKGRPHLFRAGPKWPKAISK